MTSEPISPEVHAQLCAYQLDELPPAERDALEQRLRDDPALRAELDRIAATLATVADAFPDHDRLSDERRKSLVAAAELAARHPSRQIFALRNFAAAACLLVTAYGLSQISDSRGVKERHVAIIDADSEWSEPTPEQLYASRDLGEHPGRSRDSVTDTPFANGASFQGNASKTGTKKSLTDLAGQTIPGAGEDAMRLVSKTGVPADAPRSSTLERAEPSLFNLESTGTSTTPVFEVNSERTVSEPRTGLVVQTLPTTDKSEVALLSLGAVEKPLPLTSVNRSGKDNPPTGRPGIPVGPGSPPVATPRTYPVTVPGGGRGPSSAGGGPGGPTTPGPGPSTPTPPNGAPKTPSFVTGVGGGGKRPAPNPASPAKQQDPRLFDTRLQQLGYVGGKNNEATRAADDKQLGRLRQLGYVARLDLPVADSFVNASPDRLIDQCRRAANETPSAMFFRFWGDNPFERTAIDAQSTFSVDVDTASYALARRYLTDGLIPPKEAVRTEEFINYFRPDVAAPAQETFRVVIDAAPSLFGGAPDRVMLRVALRGREVPASERLPQRLTFVVDTSGSMRQQNRMELVKHGLRLLVSQLEPHDSIALIAFSSQARVILAMTSVTERAEIEAAIHTLQPDGSTNADAGLQLGYQLAGQSVDVESTSRVILLSDGVANVGQTEQQAINDSVAAQRKKGIYLNTIGVGMGNHNDTFLEQLANHGDGLCNYIDSEKEAKRALVENFTGAMVPIARDVKIQVEFDPAAVARYRLLGYENRAIADQDFRNDAVDAGEVGSGHQVVALYELEPTGLLDGETPVATVRVRYKPPSNQGDEVSELTSTFRSNDIAKSGTETSSGYRRAVLVAQFAEFLRRSTHARADSLDLLLHEARTLASELNDPDFDEFRDLVAKSRDLIVSQWPKDDPITQAIDTLRRNMILKAELTDLAEKEDRDLLNQLDQENQRLEQQVRELLQRRLNR